MQYQTDVTYSILSQACHLADHLEDEGGLKFDWKNLVDLVLASGESNLRSAIMSLPYGALEGDVENYLLNLKIVEA